MARKKYNHRPKRDEIAKRLFEQAVPLANRIDSLEPCNRNWMGRLIDVDMFGRSINEDATDEVVGLIQRVAEICVEARIIDADAWHRDIHEYVR